MSRKATPEQDMGCALILILLVIGLFLLVKGVNTLRDGVEITCVNRTMHPGDTCRMTANGTLKEWTYEEARARWTNNRPALATAAGAVAVVGAVAAGVALTRRIERGSGGPPAAHR
ncbi:hypothetical protein ABCR94_13425 [Streptomyces sp. 21So2-11]|uniref:hypothetical protein n=1 Tax=Streptomyces sp. 21So2-11 TaxID=3144408 RepID=UPI00321AE39D